MCGLERANGALQNGIQGGENPSAKNRPREKPMAVRPKPTVTSFLSPKEKRAAIEMALEGGMRPAEVFRAVLANVYGPTQRDESWWWSGESE